MTTTQYQRGAYWERKVMNYLIGDNTEATTGYLHTLIPAATINPPNVIYKSHGDLGCGNSVQNDPQPVSPLLYGVRAAGSRGDFDLLIIGSYKDSHLSIVLGIQCKTSRLAYKRMGGDLRRIYKSTGILGVYAYREKAKPTFYPDLDEVFRELINANN